MHQHIEYTHIFKFCLITTISTPDSIKLRYSIPKIIHEHFFQEIASYTPDNEPMVPCISVPSINTFMPCIRYAAS